MKTNKTIIINNEKLETRVALLNNNYLEEYEVERKDRENILGSIFLGKIDHIQSSLSAAFVDIGQDKNAFMHFTDMFPATYEDSNIREIKSYDEKYKFEDIPIRFPVGTYLFVQVTKGPIGTKGPRVTTNLTIPGRYLVLLPYSEYIGISKKIEDPKERDRIENILFGLQLPKGMGCICRTVGSGRRSVYFKRDLKFLLETWKNIEKVKGKTKTPCLVYQELSLLERTVRDVLTEDIDEIIIDDQESFNHIKSFVSQIGYKQIGRRIKLYQKATPIFEYFGIDEKIAKIFERKVTLPSGGYICIDETEALISIDVNTGSTRSTGKTSEVIFETNLEAVDEIARQLRLRNIGGLVVIDFIDMFEQEDREKIYKRMKKQLQDDKAKTRVLPISSLGLMQMTRQREQQSLLDQVYDLCPYCHGKGKVKSALTTSVEIQRALREVLKRKQWDKTLEIRVLMHPTVLARMKNEDLVFLQELEMKYGRDLSFRGDPTIHIEDFKIIDPTTGDDLLG